MRAVPTDIQNSKGFSINYQEIPTGPTYQCHDYISQKARNTATATNANKTKQNTIKKHLQERKKRGKQLLLVSRYATTISSSFGDD